jgi:hypothetical protein
MMRLPQRRWLLLLPAVLLAIVVALGIYAYTVVPPQLVEQVEDRAETYYLEQKMGGPWDSVHALDTSGRFTLTRGSGWLDWNGVWCLRVEAEGRQGGHAMADRSEWMAWPAGGDWAVGIIKVPWSSLDAGPCY